MSDWKSFTDEELTKIEKKLSKKFNQGLRGVLILSPIICLLAPYLPGRKGRDSLAEKLGYEYAVLIFTVFWIILLISLTLWNGYNIERQMKEYRKFLRKRILKARIKNKQRGIFKSFANIAKTDLEGELSRIELDKAQSNEINKGDEVIIEVEEHTKAILNLKINK